LEASTPKLTRVSITSKIIWCLVGSKEPCHVSCVSATLARMMDNASLCVCCLMDNGISGRGGHVNLWIQQINRALHGRSHCYVQDRYSSQGASPLTHNMVEYQLWGAVECVVSCELVGVVDPMCDVAVEAVLLYCCMRADVLSPTCCMCCVSPVVTNVIFFLGGYLILSPFSIPFLFHVFILLRKLSQHGTCTYQFGVCAGCMVAIWMPWRVGVAL